jgi:hypothetical protein
LDQTPKDVAKISATGDWDACVQLIDEEEVRFGMSVLKVAGGAVVSMGLVAGIVWWLRRRGSTSSSSSS